MVDQLTVNIQSYHLISHTVRSSLMCLMFSVDLPDPPLVTSTGDRVTDALLQGWPGPPHTARAPEPQSPGPLGASTGPLGASTGPQAAHFSSCLTEMDAQLAALQSIADHMETEFVHSRMVGVPLCVVCLLFICFARVVWPSIGLLVNS